MARSYEGGSSKCRLDIQDNTMFTKSFSNQFPSKFSSTSDDMVSKPNSKKEETLPHQIESELVESVAKNIIVIALLG